LKESYCSKKFVIPVYQGPKRNFAEFA